MASLVDAAKSNVPVNVIIGNSAADLDSVCSSLAKVELLTAAGAPANLTIPDRKGVHIPVINCPASDFALRVQSVFWLKSLGIPEESLIFVDNPLVHEVLSGDETTNTLTLVDHNELDVRQRQWARRVQRISDHHVDTKAYDVELAAQWPAPVGKEGPLPVLEKAVWQRCASACTIVAEEWRDQAINLPDDAALRVAKLLAATILVDSENFNPGIENFGWCQRDTDVMSFLLDVIASTQKVDKAEAEKEMQKAYDDLIKVRFCAESNLALGLHNLLHMDDKVFQYATDKGTVRLGIPLVPVALPLLFEKFKDSFKEEMLSYMAAVGADVFAIMSLSLKEDGSQLRYLAIWANDQALLSSWAQQSEEEAGKRSMGLAKMDSFDGLVMYHQASVKHARKSVEPMLGHFFKEGEGAAMLASVKEKRRGEGRDRPDSPPVKRRCV